MNLDPFIYPKYSFSQTLFTNLANINRKKKPEISQVFLVENLCDVYLRMHGRVKIAVLFKNCS